MDTGKGQQKSLERKKWDCREMADGHWQGATKVLGEKEMGL